MKIEHLQTVTNLWYVKIRDTDIYNPYYESKFSFIIYVHSIVQRVEMVILILIISCVEGHFWMRHMFLRLLIV